MNEAARIRKQLEFAHNMAKQRVEFVCLPIEALNVVMPKEHAEKLVQIAERLAEVDGI